LIAGILLAAGQSRRFGSDKQLAIFRGQTLLVHSAHMLIDSGLNPRIVVLAGNDASVEQRHRAVLAGLDVEIAVNSFPEDGMSGSIRIGLQNALRHATRAELQGVIITVCDQPFCTPGHLQALAAAAQTTGAEMVASSYSGTAGVPAFFSSTMFEELSQLTGDRGAASIIRAFNTRCRVVPFPQGSLDIDTADDLERLS
jgi:molybdenum cofactor cytidylyltransferase